MRGRNLLLRASNFLVQTDLESAFPAILARAVELACFAVNQRIALAVGFRLPVK